MYDILVELFTPNPVVEDKEIRMTFEKVFRILHIFSAASTPRS